MATSSTRTEHLPVWVFSDAKDAKWLGGISGILNGKFSYLNLCMTVGISIVQNILSSVFTLVTPTSKPNQCSYLRCGTNIEESPGPEDLQCI